MSRSITDKRWGWEDMIHDDGNYAVKRLHMRAGQSCSWHAHDQKTETLTALEGAIIVDLNDGTTQVVMPGKSITIARGIVHRMRAPHGDCTYLESSATDKGITWRTYGVDCSSLSGAIAPVRHQQAPNTLPTSVPRFIAALRRGEPIFIGNGRVADVVRDGCAITGTELVDAEGKNLIAFEAEAVQDPMEKIGLDERTYRIDGNALKWFNDERRAVAVELRYRRNRLAPSIIRRVGGWLSIEWVPGRICDYRDVEEVTDSIPSTGVEDRAWAEWFYRERTLARLNKYCKDAVFITEVRNWKCWPSVLEGTKVSDQWHGDFSLENIIQRSSNETFSFIDFHEEPRGDVRYDFAKLIKSLHWAHPNGGEQLNAWDLDAKIRRIAWNRLNVADPDMTALVAVVFMKMAGAHGPPHNEVFITKARAWMRDAENTK